jgi:dTDP-4-amino-4,6-dideoxygalactose transaminase
VTRVNDPPIPMLNLVRTHERMREALQREVLEVMAGGVYVSSDGVTRFEASLADFCRNPHAIGVGSGTAALHLALLACGVGAQQEVVTAPNSFVATAEAILHAGARPRFVDVDPRTHLMSLEKLPGAVTKDTRAILAVHLYGNVVDVDAIKRILDEIGRSDVAVIEDCAHAVGARRRDKPVPLGAVGAFSFNPVKNLGALGDAGAVVTSEGRIAELVSRLRDHGRAGKNRHVLIGFNSRLGTIDDRVLALRLEHLEAENARRRSIAKRYDAACSRNGLRPMAVDPDVEPSYHQYVLCAPDRDLLRRHLDGLGIATAIHYPRLIPQQEAFRRLGYTARGLDQARDLSRRVLSIPCYPDLTDTEVDRIVEGISTFGAPRPEGARCGR